MAAKKIPYGAKARTATAKAARDEMQTPRRGRPPRTRGVDPVLVAKKVQVSKLLNFLHEIALHGAPVSTERLRAIEILLKKAVPDLKAVDMSVHGDHEVTLNIITNVRRALDGD